MRTMRFAYRKLFLVALFVAQVAYLTFMYPMVQSKSPLRIKSIDEVEGRYKGHPMIVSISGLDAWIEWGKTESYEHHHTIELDYVSEPQRYKGIPTFSLRGDDGANDANDCVPNGDWQLGISPNCNVLHESGDIGRSELKYVTRGGVRQIWIGWDTFVPTEFSPSFVLKTVRLGRYSERGQYELNRREAAIMGQLTKSSYIAKIYGHCGLSSIGAFYPGKLKTVTVKSMDFLNRLRTAKEMIRGISDLHRAGSDVGNRNNVMVFHNDIALTNFLIAEDGKVVLNDFNAAQFIPKNATNDRNCSLWRTKAKIVCPNKKLAPEECMADAYYDEKVDIFRFCQVLSQMFKSRSIHIEIEEKKSLRHLMKVIHSCKTANPRDRPHASQISESIEKIYHELRTQR